MYAVKVSITFKNGLTFKSISFLLVLSSSPHGFLCLHICPGFMFLKNEMPIFLKLTILLLWLMLAVACFKGHFIHIVGQYSSMCLPWVWLICSWVWGFFHFVILRNILLCSFPHNLFFNLWCAHVFSWLGHNIICLTFHLSIHCTQQKELTVFQNMSFGLEIKKF